MQDLKCLLCSRNRKTVEGPVKWNTLNTLRPRRINRNYPHDIFKCISLDENESISHKISLKYVPKVRIDNIPALVQPMAWCRSADKPLSEPMMVILLTHMCVTRLQWVNTRVPHSYMYSTCHLQSLQLQVQIDICSYPIMLLDLTQSRGAYEVTARHKGITGVTDFL